jgi:chloride channel protein, CIC family
MPGVLGRLRTSARTSFLKVKSSDHVFMILMGALIGLGGALAAVGFRYLIRLVQRFSYGSWSYNLDLVHSIPWYILIFIPAIGGLFVAPMVFRLARESKGHGVPEVMEAVALRGGVIRRRVVLIEALASAITIGTGGSVGREGPIVQIGSAFGSTVGQFLRVSAERLRTLVGCGAAAGIAGTFNAPIAGALFALEVILGDFGVSQFSPIVISSVVSTIVCRSILGNMPAFIVPRYDLVSAYEMLPYAILGLAAAFVGVGFTTLLYRAEDRFDSLPIPDLAKPLIGGLIIGAISLAFPQILGVGYESIGTALTGKMTWYLLMALICIKLTATSITLASGGSGGVFAPSLFLGAMTGGTVGTWVHSAFPSLTADPGAYAMVGMGAVVAATTHAPLTAMIIIFEMTGSYETIPPLMVACVISCVLATRLRRTSIYTEKLSRRGVQLFGFFEVDVMKRLPVSSAITREPVLVSQETPFRELVDLVVNSPRNEFFVVREGRIYVGTISVSELRRVLLDREWLDQLIIAGDMADLSYPFLSVDDNLDFAMRLFAREYIEELPVLSDGKLVGSVRKEDVLRLYNREVMRRDLPGGFHGALTWVERTKSIDLGEGYVMAELETPSHFVGRTLRQLNVRSNYGVEVILIKRSKKEGTEATIVPPADDPLQHGDVLLVAGRRDQIKQLVV